MVSLVYFDKRDKKKASYYSVANTTMLEGARARADRGLPGLRCRFRETI